MDNTILAGPELLERKNYLNKVIAIHAGLVLIWLVAPLISIAIICLFLGRVKVKTSVLFFYLFLIALVPGLINYTRVPESDLEQYYYEFDTLYKYGVKGLASISILDPVFYYTTILIAKLSGGFKPIFVLFWSTTTYFLLFIAQYKFTRIFKPWHKYQFIALVFFTVFIGVDFSITGHLVRQCTCVSMLMLGIVALCRRKKYYLTYFIIASLLHFSGFIFFILLPFLNINRRYIIPVLLVLGVICFIAGQTNLLTLFAGTMPNSDSAAAAALLGRAEAYLEKDDGSNSLRLVLEMVLYLILSVNYYFVYAKSHKDNKHAQPQKFFLLVILFGLFLVLIRNNSLLFLRFFFYSAFLSTFVIYMLFRAKRYIGIMFILIYTLTAPVRFLKILTASEFTYITNSYDITTKTVFDFLLNGHNN